MLAAVLAAVLLQPDAARADSVLPKSWIPASLDFGAYAQDGVLAHQGQVRARQNRIRDSRAPSLPSFMSGLTMSNERGSIPVQLKASPVPGKARLAPPSSMGHLNTYIRGNLHSDGRPGADSSLSTHDLTVGTDYRVSESLMFGVAAGRLTTRSASGNALSTYLTLRPVDRLYVDMSFSVGSHQARSGASFGGVSTTSASFSGLTGQTKAFSLSLSHPRQYGNWSWQPYSRLDRLVTETEARDAGAAVVGATRESSALSFGSTAETVWATPFGTLRPMMMVEVQREVVSSGSAQPTTAQNHSLVGFGLSTRVSRDVSAYAQSRYSHEGSEQLDRLVMLGVKFAF